MLNDPCHFQTATCTAGSRFFVQEAVYDEFAAKFTEIAKSGEATGDPFAAGTQHGPQVSQVQFDVRATNFLPGTRIQPFGLTMCSVLARYGQGYFIQPTILTNTRPEMKTIQEEVFGPVAALIKFKTEDGDC